MPKSFWDQPPIAIAHRGGDATGNEQENTLAAFKAAQKLDYKYGETDVILSADGQIAAIHGSRNRLQAGLKGDLSRPRLQKMTLAQIRREFGPSGLKVPTLEELLGSLPNMKFLIDPKTDEVVLPLARLLRRLKVAPRVCVGSFNHGRLRQFIKLSVADNIATSFIIGRGLRLVNKSLLMLKSGGLADVEAVQLHHSLISQPMVDLVHQRGFKALAWTCNSPLSIKNAINCGADGIISDRLTLLKEILDSTKTNGPV